LDVLLRPWAQPARNLPSWVAVANEPKFIFVAGGDLRKYGEPFVGLLNSRIFNASNDLKPRIKFQDALVEQNASFGQGSPVQRNLSVNRISNRPCNKLKLQVAGLLLDIVAEEKSQWHSENPITQWPTWALDAARKRGSDVSDQ
jgi:hypothetical protein